MAKKTRDSNDLNDEQVRFARMSRTEKADVIRPLMAAGGSYKSLARRFAVKVGRIAGICRDFKIASTHPPGFAHVQKSSSGVALRFAVNESQQCKASVDGHRCGYEKVPGSQYCALPKHQRLAKEKK